MKSLAKFFENQFKIDISQSKINIIRQLLAFREHKHNGETLYKKTKTAFEKAYKMPLKNAPFIFSDGESIWKLSHSVYIHAGREYEDISYLPMISARGKFKQLTKTRFQ